MRITHVSDTGDFLNEYAPGKFEDTTGKRVDPLFVTQCGAATVFNFKPDLSVDIYGSEWKIVGVPIE